MRRTRHHERAARRAPTAPRATRRAAHSRPLDPNEAAAVDAGLRYVRDDAPGLRRVGTPPRFAYVDPEGRRVHDAATLARIRAIAIPPAWTDVWICAAPQGHIQATGRDSRGRKQYRYHAGWRAHRDANKYARTLEFGAALRRIRAAVARDLRRPGVPKEKVIAAVVRTMDLTHARVGNREYTRQNRSYGLTTLLNRHARIEGGAVRLCYRGKGGGDRRLVVRDKRLARIVRRCEELPGQRLFEYIAADGTIHAVESYDVNEYIRAASGGSFSAKDFRTLAGTVLAARALRAQGPCGSKADWKRAEREALAFVSGELGNTVAVCRKCYVHPAVLTAFERSLLGSAGATASAEERAVFRMVARFGR